MISIQIKESALKHGITETDIRQVLADPITVRYFAIHEDSFGNPQDMVVGFTQSGVLVEIGVKYTDDFDIVFHANRVSRRFRALYRREVER
jgi:hypothetical protein